MSAGFDMTLAIVSSPYVYFPLRYFVEQCPSPGASGRCSARAGWVSGGQRGGEQEEKRQEEGRTAATTAGCGEAGWGWEAAAAESGPGSRSHEPAAARPGALTAAGGASPSAHADVLRPLLLPTVSHAITLPETLPADDLT